MAMEGKRGHQPWYPRIDSSPLFVTSAEYERGLGHEHSEREFDLADEGTGAPADEATLEALGQPTGDAGRGAG